MLRWHLMICCAAAVYGCGSEGGSGDPGANAAATAQAVADGATVGETRIPRAASTMDYAPYYLSVQVWEPLARHQAAAVSFPDWKYCKPLLLTNSLATDRTEPIEVDVEFRADQITDPAREVRVVAVAADGSVAEIPSQTHGDIAEDDLRRTRLFFLATLAPKQTLTYLIVYGNPEAAAPAYETDLQVTGDAWALDIDNQYYRIELAESMGHLKSIVFKEGHTTLGRGKRKGNSATYKGHGVESSIHHNPDWSDEHTGRYRMTSWTAPPNYEVVRGPLCVRTRRWGHPILALGPGVGRSRKVVASVTYTFWSQLPYFVMESRLDVLEDVRFRDCRNDEWVGIGRELTGAAWGMKDGTIGFGGQSWSREDPAWLSFFSEETGDAFASVRLRYECTHADWHEPASVGINDQWGGLWVRYPLHNALMRAGDFVHEKNAYLLHRYEPPQDNGFGQLLAQRRRLLKPPTQAEAPALARMPLTEANVRDALRTCYDTEVYIRGTPYHPRRLSYVDLGWVRRITLDGGAVRVDLVLPYAGREVSFGWFAKHMEAKIRERVDGIGSVHVELVREPAWSPAQMTSKGRRAIDLDEGGET